MTRINPKKFGLLIVGLLIFVAGIEGLLNASVLNFIGMYLFEVLLAGAGIGAAFFPRSNRYWNSVIILAALVVIWMLLTQKIHHLWDILMFPQQLILLIACFLIPFIFISAIRWGVTNHGKVRGWGGSFWGWLTTP